MNTTEPINETILGAKFWWSHDVMVCIRVATVIFAIIGIFHVRNLFREVGWISAEESSAYASEIDKEPRFKLPPLQSSKAKR
jgi:hypothetical protein